MNTEHQKAKTPEQKADLRWLKNADYWGEGEWERFDERQEDLDPRMVAHGVTGNGTGERELIYLLKSNSSPQARFYATGKGQVGPRHAHVMAATCWAYGNGYLPTDHMHSKDLALVNLALGCREEVLSGGVTDDKHTPQAAMS